MKTKSILITLLMGFVFSMSAIAQSGAEVIAVINEADWCSVCEENGERAMKALKSNNKDGAIQFVSNDLTNDNTREESGGKLKKLGLYEEMNPYNKTGVVFFFDAETKELINEISVAKTDGELAKAVQAAKRK